MIQNKELRIGNLVYDTSDATKIDQRVRLDEDYLEVLFAARDYGKLQPIPLTEEIFMKCGAYVSTGTTGPIYTFGELCAIEIYDEDLHYRVFCGNVCLCVINHLHQLQNLYFALTGEELNVEL